MTSTCPTCGGVRRVKEREATAVWWWCSWCKQHTREVHDLTRESLQTWENRAR